MSEPHPQVPRPEAEAETLAAGLRATADLLQDFYRDLQGRPVAPSRRYEDLVAQLRGSLGEGGIGVAALVEELREDLLPAAMAIPHPLYMGLVNSSPLPAGILSEAVIAALNNNAGSQQQSPASSAAEREVLRCFAELLGLPPDPGGLILPGGSYATLHGLQLARDHRLPAWRQGGARALSGDPRVYVSEAVHFSASRAAVTLGLAARDVVAVPVLGRGAMDPEQLAAQVTADRAAGKLPFAVVATLGTTGTGALDPLPEVLDICRDQDLWLHVDACYGGAAALLEELRPRFDRLAEADSVAVDPHKWFFVPIAAGLLLTRHRELELEVFDIDASYIPAGPEVDAFRRGFPTSRRASALAVWAVLRAHGLGTVRAAVRRTVALTRRLELGLSEGGFRVMPGGELSIACVRWEPEGWPADRLDALQGDIARTVVDAGEAWFSTVRAQGRVWMRFNLCSRFTAAAHIDRLIAILCDAAAVAVRAT